MTFISTKFNFWATNIFYLCNHFMQYFILKSIHASEPLTFFLLQILVENGCKCLTISHQSLVHDVAEYYAGNSRPLHIHNHFKINEQIFAWWYIFSKGPTDNHRHISNYFIFNSWNKLKLLWSSAVRDSDQLVNV